MKEGTELPNQERNRTLGDPHPLKKAYKYLGILKADTIKEAKMNEKTKKKYISGERGNYSKPNYINHRMKINETKKIDEYLNFARELKKKEKKKENPRLSYLMLTGWPFIVSFERSLKIWKNGWRYWRSEEELRPSKL